MPTALAAWGVWALALGLALALLVTGWRLGRARRALAETRRRLEQAQARHAAAAAALPGVEQQSRALGDGCAALQGVLDIHRAALGELASAVAVTSAQIGELARRVEAAGPAVRARPAADDAGRTVPPAEALEPTLGSLDAAAAGIGEKFARLQERAETIAQSVAALDKVSERINLLSLNAAIESEKAGERGHGFVAIAQEIRRLADHTAAASLGVARQVGRVREVVAEGVMSVDRFQAEVRGGVATARRAAAEAPAAPSAARAPEAGLCEALRDQAQAMRSLGQKAQGLDEGEERLEERVRDLLRRAEQLGAALAALRAASGAGH